MTGQERDLIRIISSKMNVQLHYQPTAAKELLSALEMAGYSVVHNLTLEREFGDFVRLHAFRQKQPFSHGGVVGELGPQEMVLEAGTFIHAPGCKDMNHGPDRSCR